jgi:hypothetical protein
MNDEIPLEEPPVNDDDAGVDVNKLPQSAGTGTPGRNLYQGRGAAAAAGKPAPAGKPASGKPAPAAAGKKQVPGNMPPVGDIQLKKKSGTYNTYTIQLSYGQIEALRQALESDHANPIGDELKALFDYYINSIPGPGEEEEDVKARDEQAAIASGQAQDAGDDDSPIPMPPGDDNGGEITTAGVGPDSEGGEDGGGLHIPPVEGEEGDDGNELPEPPTHMPDFGHGRGGQSADAHLPSPPRE